MAKTIHFNTGRQYTTKGQQITATLHDDNRVTFYDHSRGIDGEFTIKNPAFFSEVAVMGRYDRNDYECSERCWRDRNGCNSKYEGE